MKEFQSSLVKQQDFVKATSHCNVKQTRFSVWTKMCWHRFVHNLKIIHFAVIKCHRWWFYGKRNKFSLKLQCSTFICGFIKLSNTLITSPNSGIRKRPFQSNGEDTLTLFSVQLVEEATFFLETWQVGEISCYEENSFVLKALKNFRY